MKLTIIGCCGSMSGKESPSSAYLVQAEGADETGLVRTWSIILDFGSGAMGQSVNYCDPALVDAMIFSHFHADHCVDIVGMQVYRRWYPEGPLPCLPVYSPTDGAERLRGISADAPDEDYSAEFDFNLVRPGDVIEIGPFAIEFFEAWHTITTVAVRVTGPSSKDPAKRVTLTYTGDTDYVSTVVDAARDADLLLSEAAFEEGRDTAEGVHLTGLKAGRLAQEAGAKRLLLTHLQPWTSPRKTASDAKSAYDGDITVVSAGDTYEI